MTRALLLAAGAGLLAWLWGGPLPSHSESRFSAHMLLHMGVVSVAAPVIALGMAGGRWDPTSRWPLLFSPLMASVLELVVVWGWHAPRFHHAARTDAVAFVFEQSSFLVAGLWLWLAALGGGAAREAHRTWSGVAALLFTSMHMTLLGALFALAPRPLYTSTHAGDVLADLHLGGGVMLLVGGVSYLAGGLWLSLHGLRARAPYRERAA